MARSAAKQWYDVVANRDGWGCAHCHRRSVPLTLDHIIPYAAGGSNSPCNLQLLCGECNTKKGDRPDVKMGCIRTSQQAIDKYLKWAHKYGVIQKWPLQKVLPGRPL